MVEKTRILYPLSKFSYNLELCRVLFLRVYEENKRQRMANKTRGLTKTVVLINSAQIKNQRVWKKSKLFFVKIHVDLARLQVKTGMPPAEHKGLMRLRGEKVRGVETISRILLVFVWRAL